MNTILLIIQREYLVRVRKKSFIIMTILGPILLVSVYAVPFYLAMRDGEKRTIAVIDNSGLFGQKPENDRGLDFVPIQASLDTAKRSVQRDEYYAVLYIPREIAQDSTKRTVELFSNKGVSIDVESGVRAVIQNKIQDFKLRQANIDTKLLKQIESYRIKVNTTDLEAGKESNVGIATIAAFFLGFIIYMSIFLYGVQVMRGVLEEKTNRIIEVMISSVKPFQLMMGKIVGIGLVGITQFLVWILLSFGLAAGTSKVLGLDTAAAAQQNRAAQITATSSVLSDEEKTDMEQKQKAAKIFESLSNLNLPKLLAALLFYFLFGYLIYSALFAAVGAAADADTDTQQFVLPISVPLIFAIATSTYLIQNPDSSLAFWMSVIPLTSPIAMLIRMPFNPPTWEIILSMAVLIGGFLGTTWLAARIYRVGILMYGKKVSYKELSKWLFYKG
ncbi:MAG: ABC transporter permease [Cytophagales bacterium]|jgi:ABC-2 type transport system permease protein|nr:ABC transporter permease [Cytophagales bacterium]